MELAMIGRLGRNDPCRCGSGRKYKKCCLPADEAGRAAERPAPPRPQLSSGDEPCSGFAALPGRRDLEAMLNVAEVLAREDVERLRALLDRFGDLLVQGGPLAHVRFDRARFERILERRGRRSRCDNPEALRRGLFQAVARELATEEFALRAIDAFYEAASAATLGRDDRTAIHAAILTTQVALEGPGAREALAFEVLFNVQFEEWVEARARVEREIGRWAKELDAGQLTVDELAARLAPMQEELEAAAEIAPSLFEEAGTFMERALERTRKRFQGRRPPVIFTGDEIVLLLCSLRGPLGEVLGGAARVPERREALLAHFGAALGEIEKEVRDRLFERMREKPLGQRERTLRGELYAAMQSEPLLVAAWAFFRAGAAALLRGPDEAAHLTRLWALEAWMAEDLLPYQRHLEEAGQGQAAAHVQRARDLLGVETLVLAVPGGHSAAAAAG